MKTFAIGGLLALSVLLPGQQRLQSQYSPPASSAGVLEGIKFTNASPVDETYRAEFDRCDRENMFRGQAMTGFRRCSTDKNNVKALLRFPNGTIFIESKLGLDLDGSWKACHDAGAADQCATWFKWKDQPPTKDNVDSDKYPFVVIPIDGLRGRDDKEFREKTGINKGDLGIAVYKDRIVPVFVADGGPHNKLGEGSAALLKALGEDRCRRWSDDGHCQSYRDVSVSAGVLFFLFPNSKIEDISPDNALERVRGEALRRFAELRNN